MRLARNNRVANSVPHNGSETGPQTQSETQSESEGKFLGSRFAHPLLQSALRLSGLNRVFAAIVLGLSLVAAAPTAQAEGDAAAGAVKAYTCLGCHGVKHYVNTYPTYHVPKIAGQHEIYIIAALKSYRAGTRAHQTMQANAANLTDQDIADIAAYFANQK